MMIDQTRRSLIKGIVCSMAFSAAPASVLATGNLGFNKTAANASQLPTCDLTIYQQKSGAKEIVSLMNFSNETITLDDITPVGLEHINDSIIVRLNNVKNGVIKLHPGERLAFEIEAISNNKDNEPLTIPNVLAGHVRISSDHPAFNGIIPVTVFDSQAA